MRQSTLDGFETADYTDPDWLRARHFDDEMTLTEMGDMADVAASTIRRHMDKHGIVPRTTVESRKLRGTYDLEETENFHRKEWLEQKYFGENLSVGKMAEEGGVDPRTITYHMDRHGLDRRPGYVTNVLRNPGAGFVHANNDGYEIVKHSVDDHTHSVYVHRLVAIAQFGYSEVMNGVVHHRNGVKWDNRPSNLQLMESQSEHSAYHAKLRREKTA